MAPSTSVNQEDTSDVIHSNVNDSGASPSSKPATKHEEATILNPSDFTMPQKFDNPYKQRQHLKERLALGFRIFAKNGFDAGVAGHITARDPVEPDTFWLNPFGVAWPLLKASDLIRVNAEGKVVDGGPVKLLNTAAYMIHHAIHEARPDIICVAHSHSLYGQAFSSLGRNLDIISQDTCAFYNDVVLFDSFGGIVLGKEEGLRIAAALGGKKAAILQNHGLVTCGKSVESCVYWFLSLERCCHQQLLADAAAGGRGHETTKVDQEDAEFTYKSIGSELAGWFSGKPAFDMMEHESGFEYKK
ncbi:class II Aldolase and Adducin domain-containing protein [Colletotrichum graminicola]|uniref:Class II Aldolase and Adducin domain-containing protein n=1 Tax=Colletotrichum graminicola (strain M1.001 / M2 / FGSC 10212) TaxID=645133 RepID=E3QAA4_COLGM|nr:class II Aldolase and Adducin domain-containing protein [Colletotrichum graminicola M1.001]EFQ27792.1 class II Aldolase and Adducin domain-containing protein [Colletotrichum graminicola M1.001]WDK11509.1 class II Aldolase and Adducin domain-containing protein [Colletotrichum graminicola]